MFNKSLKFFYRSILGVFLGQSRCVSTGVPGDRKKEQHSVLKNWMKTGIANMLIAERKFAYMGLI